MRRYLALAIFLAAATGFTSVAFGALNNVPRGHADGNDCDAGSAPLGVDENGNVEGCFAVFDQSEADTHTGDPSAHHAPVTLSGYNYLTLVGQLITANDVALGTQTSGTYVAGVTTDGGLAITGTEGATLGLLTSCSSDQILKWNGAAWACSADVSGGGGTPNILDLSDDGSNESTDLVEIAVTNDTNSIFSEPSADKLLIDLSKKWPAADTATTATTATTANAGDSATAFFSAGTIEHERGGLEADVSAYTGLVKIAGGSTSAVTLDASVETWLGTPSSANLKSALTDETGSSGVVVFNGSPTINTPILTLIDAAGGSPTTNGAIEYNRTSEQIEIGDGAGTMIFIPVDDGNLTNGYICTYASSSNDIECSTAPVTNYVTDDANDTMDGTLTTTGFIIGSADINETELEILDGATLDTTELNYVDGVTSAIQTQIDNILNGTTAFTDFNGAVIDYNNLAATIVTGLDAVGTFESGDTFMCNEAGSGLRECDFDDLPGASGGAPADADYLVGTANGSLSAEIVVGTTPGGELGGTWGSPTIDDSLAVTSWNLTTPTFTTNFTFDSVTATAITTEAEGIGNDDTDTSLATNAAIIDYAAGIVTAASVGSVSANLDDTDASIEWEDATDLESDGSVTWSNLGVGELGDGSINEPDLDADVSPEDGDFFQYDSTGTNFTWRSGSEVLSDISAQPAGDVLTDFNTLGAASTDGEFIVATGAGVFAYESGATARTSLGLGGLATESAVDAGEYTAASIDGDDVNSNIAGRSLTLTSASPDTLDIDSEIYTDVVAKIMFEDPTADDDFTSFDYAAVNWTITGIYCETDTGTVDLDVNIDDGSASGINGSYITCDNDGTPDQTLAGDVDYDATNKLDLVINSVASTPGMLSVFVIGTKDD